MLSTENPPPDPPCSSDQIPQLKIISNERASDDNQVDLLNSGLDDDNPLPKFSIRDYVFNTRGKDIKNHWPFSPKNLQLCLKHGVKDVLPPFQTLESVRNPSIGKSAAETISNSAAENLSNSVAKSDCLSSNHVGQKLVSDVDNKSGGSEEDKECPSTTTSLSCSDVNSVREIRTTYLKPEAEKLVEKAEFAVPASNKVEDSTQNVVKKCRLIVKLSNIGEPKSNESLSVVSETMASKVCPVCKTFSSSSNTTLNAHIDQCLSGESTIKWTANSKVIKHRIKPRKTRMMVDIYATAQCCTLEDLDRRNGTNWASNLAFAVQDLEECAEEKNNMFSAVNSEDKGGEGAVYFDSNGTKLRILSKFSDLLPNSNANDDFGYMKLVKRDKRNKLLSGKKKKFHVRRHELLKCPYEQRSSSPQPDHCPEVNNGQEREFPPEEDGKEDLAQPSEAIDETKSNDFGMIKRWVGSKRTGLKKKINIEPESQRPDKIIKNVGVKCSMPSLVDKFVKRASDTSFAMLSDDNPLISTESRKRKEDSSFSSHDEYMEQPCLRKNAGCSLLQSRDCHGKKDHLVVSKCNVKQSKKEGPSVHKHCMDPPNGTENYISSRNNKKMRFISPTLDADSSFISSRMSRHHTFSSGGKELRSLKKTSLGHATLSGGKKLPSLRKTLLPVTHASVSESRKSLDRKHLEFKKPRKHYMSGSDEEAVDGSAIHRLDNQVKMLGENASPMEKAYGKSLKDRNRVLKIRKKKAVFVNAGKEGDMASRGSNSLPEPESNGVENNIDSSMGGKVSAGGTSNVMDAAVKEVEIRDEFVCEPTSKISSGEAFIAFSKSLEVLAGSSDELVSQHYIKSYEERQSDHLVLCGDEQDMFSAEKVGEDLVTSNTHVVEEINANEGEGDYFVDVDPIPIPGPPGSFLPSPGRMSSEELQGNSSLTTCRVHPSEDEHELIDMDSSDSPISATSFVSNPILPSHESQHDISEDRMDTVVENCIPFEQASWADGKPNLDESRANLISPEESPDRLKNSQPCCCSRREGVLQGGSLSYQESQLLRRRTMTYLPQDKHMSHDPNDSLFSFNFLEKASTPEAENVGINSLKRNVELKFPTSGDCESPSTSNPILRLMGKNLLVMNKEENLSPQTRPTQSGPVNDHRGVHLAADNVVSSGNSHNDHRSFHHTLSRGPSEFENIQMVQHVDMSSSDGSRIHANFRTPGLSVHPSRVMLSSKSFGGSFSSSLECHEINFNQLGSKIRHETPVRYEVDKARTPDPSRSSKHKEIIIIDDSVENEPSSAVKSTTALGYDSRHVNPFYSYQTRCYPLYSGSQIVRNANTQVPPSMGTNENLVKWDRTPEGSRLLHPNALTASSLSTGHLRSTFYFSPGFTLPTNFT